MAYVPTHQETPANAAETFTLPGTLHSQARDQHTEKRCPAADVMEREVTELMAHAHVICRSQRLRCSF